MHAYTQFLKFQKVNLKLLISIADYKAIDPVYKALIIHFRLCSFRSTITGI